MPTAPADTESLEHHISWPCSICPAACTGISDVSLTSDTFGSVHFQPQMYKLFEWGDFVATVFVVLPSYMQYMTNG